jgi:oligoendopeptidase F
MQTTIPHRTFISFSLNIADFDQLQPFYQSLLDRPLNSAEDLQRWLADFSELHAAVDEYAARRYIEKSCHTDDKQLEAAFLHYVEQIEPRIKPLFFALQKKLLDCPFYPSLPHKKYILLAKRWRADVELFRDENIPLETQVTRLANDYDKICGAMMAQFRGQEYTLQQMARFLEELDRNTRKEAWELIANRRLADREPIDAIFDQLLSLRKKISANAGLPDYRAFIWKAYKRFDYTPQDCLNFSDAIEKACMPLVRKLDQQRRADLHLETLRPYDLGVDPQNRPPLRPFQPDQTQRLVDGTRDIFSRLSPELAAQFESLRANNNLDLQSRKGKQPGGYQSSLEESKAPFIFMNAAGLQRDVEVLLHEGGHAFHFLAASQAEPLVFLRSAPMEFCEVASMSMELLGADHFDVFYPDAEAARAKRTMLEGIIRFFPWMTTIDSFQHWLYTHPGHTRPQRTDAWLDLSRRFTGEVDYTGYEAVRESLWQRQLHLFQVPFYYIEYGIAQVGALQLWLKGREDAHRALSNYRAALKLGGTRSLPELFSAAGIRFDFSARTLEPLMQAVWEELEMLPR